MKAIAVWWPFGPIQKLLLFSQVAYEVRNDDQ